MLLAILQTMTNPFGRTGKLSANSCCLLFSAITVCGKKINKTTHMACGLKKRLIGTQLHILCVWSSPVCRLVWRLMFKDWLFRQLEKRIVYLFFSDTCLANSCRLYDDCNCQQIWRLSDVIVSKLNLMGSFWSWLFGRQQWWLPANLWGLWFV